MTTPPLLEGSLPPNVLESRGLPFLERKNATTLRIWWRNRSRGVSKQRSPRTTWCEGFWTRANLAGCFFNECAERLRVGYGEFAEHLPVDLDALLIDSAHEVAVPDAIVAAGRADSDNPELSEITLLLAAIAEGILPRLHHLLMSTLEDILLPTEIAGCLTDNFLVALVAH